MLPKMAMTSASIKKLTRSGMPQNSILMKEAHIFSVSIAKLFSTSGRIIQES